MYVKNQVLYTLIHCSCFLSFPASHHYFGTEVTTVSIFYSPPSSWLHLRCVYSEWGRSKNSKSAAEIAKAFLTTADKHFARTIWPNLNSGLMMDEEIQLSGWTKNIYQHNYNGRWSTMFIYKTLDFQKNSLSVWQQTWKFPTWKETFFFPQENVDENWKLLFLLTRNTTTTSQIQSISR